MNASSDWFKGVPQRWPVIPIKYGFRLIGSGTTPPTGEARFYDGAIPWVNTSELRENVVLQTEKTVTTDAVDEFTALKTYPVGTVLFAMYGATIGRVAVLGVPATVNQAVCALADPSRFTPRFVFYGLQASREFLAASSTGGGQPNLNAEKVREHKLPCPNLQTQRAIADYLDRETARLDSLVAAKERVLGLLAEKRRALITRAVTCGLDPRAPLRDSGIPWLGEIPAHWEVTALRFLVDIFGGATPNTGKPELWDGEIPWVSPKDMKREEIADAEDHVSPEALDGSALRLIDPIVVLVVVRGMILAHSFPTATTTRQVTINQDMKALRCRTALDPHYLRRFFSGLEPHLVSLVDSAAHGTRKLETEALGRFEVCVPPMAEQRAIVEYIADGTSRLDRLRAATERTVALLKERRAALIAAAVTGQIDLESAA